MTIWKGPNEQPKFWERVIFKFDVLQIEARVFVDNPESHHKLRTCRAWCYYDEWEKLDKQLDKMEKEKTDIIFRQAETCLTCDKLNHVCELEDKNLEITHLKATINELTKTLETMSRQRTSDEAGQDPEYEGGGDYEYAYNWLVLEARQALAKTKENTKCGGLYFSFFVSLASKPTAIGW